MSKSDALDMGVGFTLAFLMAVFFGVVAADSMPAEYAGLGETLLTMALSSAFLSIAFQFVFRWARMMVEDVFPPKSEY